MSSINNNENSVHEMSIGKTFQIEENVQKRKNITDLDVAQYEFTIALVEAIISKRKAMKLSQEQLAKIAGVGRATIARLESWQRVNINLTVTFKILNALDLKVMITDKN